MKLDVVIDGRYEVGDVIGWGATADVHRGHDVVSGRAVAIKVLRADLARDPVSRSRFHREGLTMAGLSHRGIVAVYDTGQEELDTGSAGMVPVPVIVMEYVPGHSLRDLIKMRLPTVNETIQYQVGMLSALEFSHRAGVVHRDIKPANVMVTPEGAVKVVDFGLSRASGHPAATLSQASGLFGTPSYVSPEQARGETVDARTDLYSAGCVLYELLTGKPPFIGDDPVCVVYQHIHEQPVLVRTDLPGLNAALAKALAKERDDRFQDATSFIQALLFAVKDTQPAPDGALASTFGNDARVALAVGNDAGLAQVAC
ncbi:protein kinase domain-containing protein [Nocardioides houyundeii]|uniref:protein kinase domain-containing protein n=1 Tax=Nocardioides houyundeii TaxID=2045452 RepID=UPI0013B39855|nr:protein kinase [Nocardioides houyundeii]